MQLFGAGAAEPFLQHADQGRSWTAGHEDHEREAEAGLVLIVEHGEAGVGAGVGGALLGVAEGAAAGQLVRAGPDARVGAEQLGPARVVQGRDDRLGRVDDGRPGCIRAPSGDRPGQDARVLEQGREQPGQAGLGRLVQLGDRGQGHAQLPR